LISISSAKIKILLIGDVASGKDELIKRVIKNRFQQNYKLTVGVDILTKDVEYESGEFATLSMWDIKGTQRFESIRTTFYKDAAGAIIIFNLYMKNGLIDATKLVQEFRQNIESSTPILLVGNDPEFNSGLEYAIDVNEARDFAKRENLIYITTTMNTRDYFNMAITEITHRIMKNRSEGIS
jgi:small GTP-binding protein